MYLSATFPHSFLFRTPQNKFKEVTGKDFGPPKKEKKVKKSPEDNQQQPSAKNAEKKAAKAAAKAAKEAKKNANRLEREKREKEKAARLAGVGATNFGDAKMVQSVSATDQTWTEISDLKPNLAGSEVVIRGHLQTSRLVGKGAFILIRSSLYSVQGVCFEGKEV